MNEEDLTVITEAGRRCSGCHTGRRWKDFSVLRSEGRDPIVACPACKPRLEEQLVQTPAPAAQAAAAAAKPKSKKQPAKPQNGRASAASKQTRPPEDRLRRALRELPAGKHSTGRIAKAAGLNHAKVLARLHALEEAGEVQQIGKHWTAERPSTDLEAAFDRLQARTGNLRIVREKERVN